MAAPAYWLTFEDKSGYLLARVQGLTDSLETSISFWQEIFAEAFEQRVERLLVEESFRNNLTAEEMREISRFMAEQASRLGLKTMRIAFLDARAEQLDDNRAGESASVEFGLCVKIFADYAAAEAWLLTQ